MVNNTGKIIIPANSKPWPHEVKAAEALANAGFIVEFLPRETGKSPDFLLNDIAYELKSPLSCKERRLIKDLKEALNQSANIIFDSLRVKQMTSLNLQRLLENKAKTIPRIKRFLFITKDRRVIDILKQS